MQKYLTLIVLAVGLLIGVVAVSALRSSASGNARQMTEPETARENTDSAATITPDDAAGRVPVIVELFTSEGCSSCPPADDNLARLERTQPIAGAEVIALGQHVDYWNRLGWTDPFSSQAFSQRQGRYSEAFGRDGVYTPQMIVDGQTEFAGGNQGMARTAITKAAQMPKATVGLKLADGATAGNNSVTFDVSVANLPAVRANDAAEVWLAITESNLRTDVPRGENAGRSLAHTAVVRQMVGVGVADARAGAVSTAQTVATLEGNWRRKNLRAVVFVQERDSRRILGAASLKLAGE